MPAPTPCLWFDGQALTLLDAGPHPFTETVSSLVDCADQDEVDHCWDALTADGGQESRCGGSRTTPGSPGRSCRPRCRP